MGIKLKLFAECDICGATSYEVSTVARHAVKLPDGWVHNTMLGVMCESCKKKRDDEEMAAILRGPVSSMEYPYQALYKLDENGATLVSELYNFSKLEG